MAAKYEKFAHISMVVDLARELKTLWNMKMTRIPNVIGALDTVTKRLDGDRPKDLMETVQDWPEYRGESWTLEGTCCHSNSSERLSADATVKNSQMSKITIIIICCKSNSFWEIKRNLRRNVPGMMKSPLSSCCAACADISDPLSPRLSIIHRLWQVFRVTSRIIT